MSITKLPLAVPKFSLAEIKLPMAGSVFLMALTNEAMSLTKFSLATLELSLALTKLLLALTNGAMATIELPLAGSELPLATPKPTEYQAIITEAVFVVLEEKAKFSTSKL